MTFDSKTAAQAWLVAHGYHIADDHDMTRTSWEKPYFIRTATIYALADGRSSEIVFGERVVP